MALTLEWAAEHREALMEDWNLCAIGRTPNKIPPLE
jgi:methylglyoxal synthase